LSGERQARHTLRGALLIITATTLILNFAKLTAFNLSYGNRNYTTTSGQRIANASCGHN
jgi:hypothetical protein